MKRRIWLIGYLVVLLLMSACGSTETKSSPEQRVEGIAVPDSTATSTPTAMPALTVTPTPSATPALTATPSPTNTPTPTPKPSVTLVMAGDILLHTRIEEYSVQEDGSYNFDAIFAPLTEKISQADLALVNQEVILGGEELGISGYPAFNAPYEVGDALVKAGFDVVLHATNHALDKGKKGFLNCLDFWEETYPEIGVLGIHDSKEDQEEIYITEIEGIRIAVLNYTYGTNGISMPKDMPFAVDLLEEKRVTENIRRAKEQSDFVIVCPHWGTEYRLKPDNSQKRWTELFLKEGVDLVLGTHPHVVEPIELITEDETGEQMLVYYSVGNFVNWTSGEGAGVANRMVGGMAEVTIELDENGEAYIADYGVEAVVCHVEPLVNGVTVYLLSEYTEELAERNAIRSQDTDFSLEYCFELCDEVWGELWRNSPDENAVGVRNGM